MLLQLSRATALLPRNLIKRAKSRTFSGRSMQRTHHLVVRAAEMHFWSSRIPMKSRSKNRRRQAPFSYLFVTQRWNLNPSTWWNSCTMKAKSHKKSSKRPIWTHQVSSLWPTSTTKTCLESHRWCAIWISPNRTASRRSSRLASTPCTWTTSTSLTSSPQALSFWRSPQSWAAHSLACTRRTIRTETRENSSSCRVFAASKAPPTCR